MNTPHTRRTAVGAALGAVVGGAVATARRSQKRLNVLAVALGAILLVLTLSATVAHAAPGDGGDVPTTPRLQVYASENPVVFAPGETHKGITISWTPPISVTLHIDKHPGGGAADGGLDTGSTTEWVSPGYTYTFWVESTDTHEVSPKLTITTGRIRDPRDITLVPKPGLPGPGPKLPGLVQPGPN
jgi:hypothetical protein